MDKFLQTLESVNGEINSVVWGMFGLLLLIGTGIIVTILTKFFQIGHIGLWFKNTLGSLFNKEVIHHSKEKGSISPFQALCTALAATVGTGNIAGVAAAMSAQSEIAPKDVDVVALREKLKAQKVYLG